MPEFPQKPTGLKLRLPTAAREPAPPPPSADPAAPPAPTPPPAQATPVKRDASFKGRRRAIGIDIGSAAVKVVALDWDGKAATAVTALELADARQEGILDEKELFAAAAERAKKLTSRHSAAAIALPQFFGTSQVTDFAPEPDDAILRQMVDFKTQQMGGLSDESYIYDFRRNQPDRERANPVFILLSRETTINEYLDTVAKAGLDFSEAAMSGIGVLNALAELHPECRSGRGLQIVLDIGAENTVMAILAGGDILLLSSLNFGNRRFVQTLASSLEIDEARAEKKLAETRLSDSYELAPLLDTAQTLLNEVIHACEQWRAMEPPESGERPVERIWLCGGGACLAGLGEFLQRHFGCPATAFGPPGPDGRPSPLHAAAHGLALQAIGLGAYRLSHLPQERRWRRQRLRNLPWLIGASVLLQGSLILFLGLAYQQSRTGSEKLQETANSLSECQGIVSNIGSTAKKLEDAERVMVPFIWRGNTTLRLEKAIDAVGKAALATKDVQIFYIATDDGYLDRDKAYLEEAKAGTKGPLPERRAATPKPRGLFGAAAERTPATAKTAGGGFSGKTFILHEIPKTQAFYVFAETPKNQGNNAHFQRKVALIATLAKENAALFNEVDEPSESEGNASKDELVKKGFQNRYPFCFRLELSPLGFDLPPPPKVVKGKGSPAGAAPAKAEDAEEGSKKED